MVRHPGRRAALIKYSNAAAPLACLLVVYKVDRLTRSLADFAIAAPR
jgi:DNA invertase Pin-like site-specific DNA recombinase